MMGYLPKEPKRPWKPKPKIQEGRKKDFSKIYNSTKHRNQRKIYLKNNPLCVNCERHGIIKEAIVFDHIIPLSLDSSNWAKWSFENKQGLCNSCHNKKSGHESQAAQKRNKKNGL